MGNSSNPEHLSGAGLIAGISTKSLTPVENSVNKARKEFSFSKSTLKSTADESYENMLEGMSSYLNKKYDVGEGKFNKKTPVEYAESLGAEDIVNFLKSSIQDIESKMRQPTSLIDNVAVGVSSDRVVLAKARLEVIYFFCVNICAYNSHRFLGVSSDSVGYQEEIIKFEICNWFK